MAGKHLISCEICGSDRLTSRKNTKYCSFHRLFIDRAYVTRIGKVAKCSFCDRRFIPVPHNVQVCAECYGPPEANGTCTCPICKQEDQVKVHPEISVCGPCFEDPKHKDLLNRSLKHKNDQLVAHPVHLVDAVQP